MRCSNPSPLHARCFTSGGLEGIPVFLPGEFALSEPYAQQLFLLVCLFSVPSPFPHSNHMKLSQALHKL